MRVLITGGLGVIGSQIAREYLEAGHGVVIIDACEEPRNEWLCSELLKHERAPEVWNKRIERHPDIVRTLVSRTDAVIHAAASTGIPHSRLNSDDDWRSNVDATKVLLDALREHPIPTVVLSSVKPYRTDVCRDDEYYSSKSQAAQMRFYGGLDEDVPLEPDEPYAASKASQSMLATAWARSYGIPVVTLRCSNLYGPAPCHGPRHGWLTWFCISAAIGRTIEIQGGGEQARDMLYASDVASVCRAALEIAPKQAGEIFNIGGGHDNIISVRLAATHLQELSGVGVTEGPGRANEDQLVFANHKKFTDATGWRPQVDVGEGLGRVYAWARQNREELKKLYEGV